MKIPFVSLLNLFNFKKKSQHMTIAELKAFNICKEKIEKEKRSRAYISEINERYSKFRKKEKNFFRKAF